MPDLFASSSAMISPCGRYRYRLDRRWGNGPACSFIMLNPSTADAEADDPTIRRCIGFAKREGCGRLIVVNKYAYRATDPSELNSVDDPYGPEYRTHFGAAIEETDGPVIAAWGAWAPRMVGNLTWGVRLDWAKRMQCLGKTKGGHPRHPLYVRANAPLVMLTGGAG